MYYLKIPFFFALIIIFGCRGGGADPSKNIQIPIIEPTPSEMYCQNMYYSNASPQLEALESEPREIDLDGLEYFILEDGEAEKPDLNSLVITNYTGWLENGCIFDSSYIRSEPGVFPLGGVIQGWQKGISKIGKNGKIFIKIPYNLGYGSQGAPPRIPGNSNLYFYVELLEITTVEEYLKDKNDTK